MASLRTWLKHATLAALCAQLTVSCKGCHETGPTEILALAPADSPGMVQIHDVGGAARAFSFFLAHATHKAGGGFVRRLREGMGKQLGFDPLDADAYGRIGLRPGAGALVFVEPPATTPILALGIGDKSTFDRTLRALITRIDGANKFTDSTHGGRSVTTAGRPFGDTVTPAFHWAYVGDWVLLVRGDHLPGLDHALGRLPVKPAADAVPPPSLLQDPNFIAARDHLPAGLVTAYARSKGIGQVTSTWRFGADGLSCDTQLTLVGISPDALSTAPVLPLADVVAQNAAAIFLSRAATPAAWEALRQVPALLPWVGKQFDPMETATGLRLQEDILPKLAGPVTASLELGDLSEVATRLRSLASPSAALDVLRVTVTAQLKDPKGMATLLSDAQGRLKSRGIPIRSRTAQGQGLKVQVFEPDTLTPRLGWTVFKDHYVYGAGTGALETALARLAAGDTGLAAHLNRGVVADLAGAQGGLLVVRGAQLAATLDQARGGNAPQSMGVQGLMASIADILRTVDDVALSFDIDAGGLRIRAREQLQ